MAWWRHVDILIDQGQHWLKQWLVAWWYQAPMLTAHQSGFVAFTWEQFHSECHVLFCTIRLKIICLQLLPQFPGANEIICLLFYSWLAQKSHVMWSTVISILHSTHITFTTSPNAGMPGKFLYGRYSIFISLALSKSVQWCPKTVARWPNVTHKRNGRPIVAGRVVRFATDEFPKYLHWRRFTYVTLKEGLNSPSCN